MSITDELREYANGWSDRGCFKRLIAIADRIDGQAEGEYARGYTAGFSEASDGCETTDELRERIEREYVKAPVDVDGVPIRIGDRVRIGYTEFEVIGFGNVTCDDETYGVFMQHESGEYEWFNARFLHHASDSWEHIIKDAVKLGYADYPTTYQEAELVERCKRLAGE